MERQLSLLQNFVRACCGNGAEGSVQQLMAPALSQPHRLLGAVLALILAGSGGVHHKGGVLDLERQDAHGCTLMHYVCALRNMPALQLLVRAQVDPNIRDNQGMSVCDWARAFHFTEGEVLLSRAPPSGAAVPASAAPALGGECSLASAAPLPPIVASPATLRVADMPVSSNAVGGMP